MLSQSRIDASIRVAFDRGEQKGIAKGLAEGEAKGREDDQEEGINARSEEIARKMLSLSYIVS